MAGNRSSIWLLLKTLKFMDVGCASYLKDHERMDGQPISNNWEENPKGRQAHKRTGGISTKALYGDQNPEVVETT